MTNTKQEWIKRFEEIPALYLLLEEKGHIQKGAVSENINWEEIIAFITAEKEASYQERNEEIKRIINAIDIYKETHQKTPHLMYLGAIQSDLKSLLQSLPIKKEGI